MPPRILKQKEQLGPTYIRAWREHRNLSQDRLVERMRELVDTFSKSTLSRIERSRQAYTQPVLEALAICLGCEPADLIMRDPNSPIWSIWDSLRTLEPDQQQQVARIIETFKRAA